MSQYELLQELGRGGMGVVHRARHVELQRDVALKLLLPGVDPTDAETARFLREIEALKRLSHPNIVRVIDSGKLDDRWYYAMDLIEGQSLDRVLVASGAMPLVRAVKIARQTASALAACHAAGFLHRDIKPGNLMIGANDHLTLMDFGLVKVQDCTVLTATGAVMGTPHYVAPEVLKGEPLEATADVYALGIVLLEMIQGKPPFRAESMGDLLSEILHVGPMPIDELQIEVPGALGGLARRMVSTDPKVRPSAAEIAKELESVNTMRRTGRTGAGRRVSSALAAPASAPAPRAVPRRAALLLGVGLLLVTALSIVAGVAWRSRRAPAIVELAPASPVVPVAEGLAVQIEPARTARVRASRGRELPSGAAWTLTSPGAPGLKGRLDRAMPLELTDLTPGLAYDVSVQSAAAAPLTTHFTMPRMIAAEHRIGGDENALEIRFFQPEGEPLELRLTTVSGKPLWSGRTSERAYFAVARGLTPATEYQLHVRSLAPGTAFAPDVIPCHTDGPGERKLGLAKIRNLQDLDVIATAGDMGGGMLPPDVDLLPQLMATLKEAAARHDAPAMSLCLEAISEVAEPSTLAPLIELAKQEWDPVTTRRLIHAIGKFSRAAGFDAVLALANRSALDPGEISFAYAEALYRCDPQRTEERFGRVVADLERYSALDRRALGAIAFMTGAPSFTDALVQRLKAHPDGEVGANLAFNLSLLPARLSAAPLRALSEHWLAHPDQPPGAGAALRMLARVGTPADVPLMERWLQGANPDARSDMAIALGMLGGPAAEQRLIALLDDPDGRVRRRAAHALGRLGARAAVDPLVARLATARDSWGRVPRALGWIGEPRAGAALVELLKKPEAAPGPERTSAEVDRAEALWALGYLRDPGARAVLERHLASPVPYVRLRAAEGLGWLGDASVVPALEQALARADEKYAVKAVLRQAIAWAQGKGRPRGRPLLIDPAEHDGRTDRELWPGESFTVGYIGGWAKSPGAPLHAPAGDDTGPECAVRCGNRWEKLKGAGPRWFDVWRGGRIAYEVPGSNDEAYGFVTAWFE